jgi:hypothetical protein
VCGEFTEAQTYSVVFFFAGDEDRMITEDDAEKE